MSRTLVFQASFNKQVEKETTKLILVSCISLSNDQAKNKVSNGHAHPGFAQLSLYTPGLKNNGDPKHTEWNKRWKKVPGRHKKGSLWSLFQGGQISETLRTSSPTAPLLGLKLQSWFGGKGGIGKAEAFPKNRRLSAYRTHFDCFWQGRTVVKSLWSQEQVRIWQITPIKTVMSTTIEHFGKAGNVHLWEPGKIWQIFCFPSPLSAS